MQRERRRRRARAAVAVASLAAVALLGACGDPASEAKATSLEDVLGIDEASFEEREAKVQEEIRRCMQEQGFEYVSADLSGMRVVRRSPGQEDTSEFRRTQGYGITTRFGEEPVVPSSGAADDPNQQIRESLSEADREAYDKALFGAAAQHVGDGGDVNVRIGGGVRMATRAGPAVPGDESEDMGCFGTAQEKVSQNDRIQELGPKLQELQERIESDPRMVEANADWSACMADAGFDYEKPEDVVPYLFERLSELRGDETGDGALVIGPGGPPADSPELDALRAEELALARADDECSLKTGRRDTAAEVRAVAERRFLEENPDLGADPAGEG